MNSKSLAKSADSLKAKVLGKNYELSLVVCGNALSRRLNRTYRGKDKPTNVLAFPLSKNSGEIFINKDKLDGFSPTYLLIHAILHLKGMQHGAKMESEEKKLLKFIQKDINGSSHISRHRHRKSQRQDRRSRGS